MTTTSLSRTARTATRRRRDWRGWAFVAPFMLVFVAMIIAPVAYALYLSFFREQLIGGNMFAGFSNYVDVFQDAKFWESFGRVALFLVVQVPIMLTLSLIAALALDSARLHGARFFRIAIFLPYAVPAVISSLLWGFLYLPAVSPFYYLFHRAAWDVPNVLSSQLVIFAVANIAVWGGTGFNMIVIYTALKAIPTELYEAAKLDGCSEVAIAWRIKVPIVVPSIIMTFVFSMIATLQVFAEPVTLRPLTNTISTTWTPLMKVYRDAFTRNDIYSAAATSVVIAVATFILSFGFLRLVQSRAFSQEKS